jgi:hypothetical protein
MKLDGVKELKMKIMREHIFVTGFCGQYTAVCLAHIFSSFLLKMPGSDWVGVSAPRTVDTAAEFAEVPLRSHKIDVCFAVTATTTLLARTFFLAGY